MPIVEKKQDTTPATPPSGYVEWFINGEGIPKLLDSAGALTTIGGAEALVLGTSLVATADKDFSAAPNWTNPRISTGVNVVFNWDDLAIFARSTGSFITDGLLAGMAAMHGTEVWHITKVEALTLTMDDGSYAGDYQGGEQVTLTANAIPGGTLAIANLVSPPVPGTKYKVTIDAFGAVTGSFAGVNISLSSTFTHEHHIFELTASSATAPLVLTGVISYVDIEPIVTGSVDESHTQVIYPGTIIEGPGAGVGNTSNSVAIYGDRAGALNTGSAVTVSGTLAGYANTGAFVTASGFWAAWGNIGNYCAAFGGNSLRNNTGDDCSALGLSALRDNKGTCSSALGFSAGRVRNGQTTNYCTFLGASTVCASSLSNSTAVGYAAAITADNQIMLGNTSVADVSVANVPLLTVTGGVITINSAVAFATPPATNTLTVTYSAINYTILSSDHVVILTGSTARNFHLPHGVHGMEMILKNHLSTTGVMVIDAYSGDTIDGYASLTLTKGQCARLVYCTTQSWVILSISSMP